VGNVSKHSQDEKAAIGERLASARKLKGITQLEAAAKLEITKAALSAWETGRNLPDALMLRRLAKTYETSSDALLWDDSLTPESMKFAAEYDALSDANRRKFIAMWKAYYAEAATDELVSQTIKAAPRGKVQHRDSEKL
jgi:transcriptional regulator with XRE-family HTH domain